MVWSRWCPILATNSPQSFSDGSTKLAFPKIVAGRKYAAFIADEPLRLTRLAWLNAADAVLASTTAVPLYGYLQFQP